MLNEVQIIRVALDGRAMLCRGLSFEDVIRVGRKAGGSKIDCIRILQQISDMNVQRAKQLVHHSEIWADRKDDGDMFPDDIEKNLEGLAI